MAKHERRENNDDAATEASATPSYERYGLNLNLAPREPRLLRPKKEQLPRRHRPLREVWSELWETEPPVFPLRLGPGAPWPKTRHIEAAFLTSTLVHSAVVFFYYAIPFALLFSWLLGRPPEYFRPPPHRAVVEITHLDLANYLPIIKSPGEGKAPGRGAKRGERPRLGATHFDPRITIISNPPHPDNFRLTLRNPTAPPILKLPKDLKIPDFIAGGPQPLPAPPKFSPPPAEKAEKPAAAPPPKPLDFTPTVPKTRFVLPAPPPLPVQLAMKLPDIPTPHIEIPATPPPPPVKNASPPAPGATPAPLPQENAGTSTTASSNAKPGTGVTGNAQKPGGGPTIMSLSVEPVPLTDISKIPGGVHEGAFSISPAGTVVGTPGGVPGGAPDVGEGGEHGPGGDKSTAVGNGKGPPGGGGGNGPGSAEGPSVSISGPAGSTGITSGTLPPLKPEDLVFPVKPEAPKVHAPTMVINSGAGGGGGLRVFGVLHSDKIYTVYLGMPAKSWILEFCAHENPPPFDPGSRVVHL